MTVVAERGPVDGRALVDEVLRLVQERTGFALVMATRVVDDDWRVVAATANPYAVEEGDTFRWSDSICSRMVGGGRPGPWSIPVVDDDLAACTAPVRARVPIASYLGAPLLGPDGDVIGTVCAIDPNPADRFVESGVVLFAADLIGFVFAGAARSAATERAAERALLRADPTQAVLVDRRQWDHLLAAEIERTRWSGETLTVAMARVPGWRRHPDGVRRHRRSGPDRARAR